MTQDTLNSLQQVTLQIALIVAVIVLWFELKAERKARDTMVGGYMASLSQLSQSVTKLMEQINEAQRFTINLMKDRADQPVLPSKLPGDKAA